MVSRLQAAAMAAGLSDDDKVAVAAVDKAYQTHKKLRDLPTEVAQAEFSKLPFAQQQALTTMFGEEDEAIEPKRSFIGTAKHYVVQGLLAPFKLANELSDMTTQGYRTYKLTREKPILQRFDIIDTWKEAGDTGEKVFNEERIKNARKEYGDDAVAVGIEVASGKSLAKILQDGTLTPGQQEIAARVANNPQEAKKFQNTIDAIQAAKYSPGRQAANAILPGQLEGSGLFYRPISGAVDAAWRVYADPLLALGKIAKTVKVLRYSIDIMMGGGNKMKWWQVGPLNPRGVDEVFAEPKVQNFWNVYGKELDNLRTAQKAGNTKAAVAARDRLKTIAPEFGPSVIDEFNKISVPIKDAATAKAYFSNATEVVEILKGQPGRIRPLVPRLDTARKIRIATLTAANKVFDVDKVGSKLVQALYFGTVTNDGIAEKITQEAGQKQIVEQLKGVKPKGIAKYSTAQIQYRMDRFKQKFSYVPFFQDDAFDVMGKDADEKIYRLARLTMPQYYSKTLREAFAAADEGTRKEIFYGLWKTMADFRGLSVSTKGKEVTNLITKRGGSKYASNAVRTLPNGQKEIFNPSVIGPDGESMALIPSQLTSFVSAPSIKDLDRYASRDGLFKVFGNIAHSEWAERMTSYWSFLTLAGPRYAMRNATEDLMVHLAIGSSPWGLVKGRINSTTLRTVAKYDASGKLLTKVATDPLGVVNRVIRKSDREVYAAKMAAAGSNVTKVREVLAEAVVSSKLNKLGGRFTQKDAELLAEQIRYGDLDNALADVVQGGKAAFTGTDFASRSLRDQKRYGRVTSLKIDVPKNMRRVRGRGYTDVGPLQDEASSYAWLMQINFWANDELGSIAVANLKERKIAVEKIKQWLIANPDQKNRFRLYTPGYGETIDTHAERIYEGAKSLFVKRDGNTINDDLLSKVRVRDPLTGEYKIEGSIGLDDLPKMADDAPESVTGPVLIPVSDSDNYTASLMTRGWDWMGEANARYSREPMVYQEMVTIRRQMRDSGFEKAYIQAHTKGVKVGDTKALKKAEDGARKKLAEITEDRAKARVLSFVDNPLVQTQLAFNIRNFARFYRATEDFARRISRTVRYNPESIARAALTYDGIAHSGWVQEDDNGELYFIYPGTAVMYKAMQAMMVGFGIEPAFKAPMPVEFGAKLNMVTPSLNPEGIFPTFAGPVAGTLVKGIENILNVAFDNPAWVDTAVGTALGKYAVDQPMLSALLPAHVNRVYSALNRDERVSQYASAFRKSVTYLEAAGYGLKEKRDADGNIIPPSQAELVDYQQKLKASTITVLALRAFAGLVLPASPQLALKTEMSEWVRDNGSQNFKQVFNEMLAANDGDIDKTTARWIQLFPDKLPYTITESDRSTVAIIRYAEGSGEFVEQNKELFKKYPQGAAFLIPNTGEFSWDSYRLMTGMGLRTNKRVDEFLKEVQSANALRVYYDNRENFYAQLDNAFDPYSKKMLREKWAGWSEYWKKTHPLIQDELAEGGQRAIQRTKALDDLVLMLNDQSVTVQPKTRAALGKMVELYDKYKTESSQLDLLGSVGNALSDELKLATIAEMKKISETNSNAKSAFDVLFSRLLD